MVAFELPFAFLSQQLIENEEYENVVFLPEELTRQFSVCTEEKIETTP